MAGGKNKSKNERRKKDHVESRAKKIAAKVPAMAVAVNEPEPQPAPARARQVEVEVEADAPVARGSLSEMVPVRFDAQMLADVKRRAAEDHRSVSSWIRRAVDHDLQRGH